MLEFVAVACACGNFAATARSLPGHPSAHILASAMAKVLVIDSEGPVAKSLSDALRARGHEVEVTGDGAQGLDLARSLRPRLVILCVELSRGSGYSVCNKLKKDPELAAIPLILTSSQATDETFEQHKKLRTRAEEYLKKPFAMDQILTFADKYLGAGVAAGAPSAKVTPRSEEFEVSLDDFSVDVSIDEPAVKPAPAMHAAKPAPHAPVVAAKTADEELFDLGVEPEPPRAKVVAPAERPAARPAPAMRPAPSAAAPSGDDWGAASDFVSQPTQVLVSSAEGERQRSEVRQLRQKVQQLEGALEAKELEFNDRLLAESGRARDSIDLKKKLALVEREISKHQQDAEKARADAQKAQKDLEATRAQMQTAEQERQILSDKIGQLVDKVKSLAAERDGLQQQLDSLRQQQSTTSREAEDASKVREKAKKAVDIAVQLITETGYVQ